MWNGRYMVHFDNPEGVKPLPYKRQFFVAETEGCVLFGPEGVKPLPYCIDRTEVVPKKWTRAKRQNGYT